MLDVEPVIKGELEHLAGGAEPAGDWADVLARAGARRRPGRGRALLLLAAAIAALVVAAIAVAASFGGFQSWLSGEPGKPASPNQQAAFERVTRSWHGFPHATQLRELVTADVRGVHYELDGFRGAGSLCLRFVATGSASTAQLACAPLADLRAARAPGLVLQADEAIGKSASTVTEGPMTLPRPVAAVTFGVLADGVQRVAITHRRPAATQVFVAGDAFVAITPGLSPFNVTTKIVASAGKASAAIPFVPSGAPLSAPVSVALPKPTGPIAVQRKVTGGAIRWFARREPRGTAVPASLQSVLGTGKGVAFARLITPDPSQPERMIVSIRPAGSAYFGGRLRNDRQVCSELVGGRYQATGCWPAGRMFSTAPFTFGLEVQRGGQVDVVSGLASDDVATMKLFPAIGGPRPIALHDNGYYVAATLEDLPIRIVAYDHAGRVVGDKVFTGSLPPPHSFPSPAAGARWTKVLANKWGSVYTAPSTDGGLCVAFTMDGGTSDGCDAKVVPGVLSLMLGSDTRYSWVAGQVPANVRRLRVHLRNGRVVEFGPIHRYVLYRFDHSTLVDHGYRIIRADGLDAGGRTIIVQRYGR